MKISYNKTSIKFTRSVNLKNAAICKRKINTAAKEIRFHYADMHGNLKVVLNTPIRNRYVVGFKTKEDTGQILASLGTDDYEEISYEEY